MQQSGAGIYYVDTSSSTTAYTLTVPNYAGNNLGSWFFFQPNLANTGAATLNVNSLGAKSITKFWDQALVSGDLAANVVYVVFYNGTNFVLMNPTRQISMPAPRLTLYDTSDATKTVTFAADKVTTGTTRTLTLPDTSGILLASAQKQWTFSATPAFDTTQGSVQQITLTGTVTSSTINSGVSTGQRVTFYIVENGTGGWTFTWPTNVKGPMTINTAANKSNTQSFFWNGANWIAENAGTNF